MSHFRLAFILALTVALGPFAIDAYLPAFPFIAESLQVPIHDVSLSISVYILTLAVGQLVGGPLADRYGRQPIMLSGLLVFLVASALLYRTDSLSSLLWLRALQAFGGGWATACVPALVRDQVHGAEAAKLFSLIALIMVAAPAVAPSLGGLILHFADWRGIFLFLSVYSLFLLLLLKFFLFSHPSGNRYQADKTPAWQRYLSVLKTRPAWRFILIQASVFTVMMLFVTHSSFVYQGHYQVSTTTFGLLFGANIVLMALMNVLNRSLLNFYSPQHILRSCLVIQALAVAFLLCVAYWQLPLWCFVVATVLIIGMFGGISPNTQACYMNFFDKNGGTAGALMGAFQFSVAGSISTISALLPEALLTIVAAQALCCALGLLAAWWPQSSELGAEKQTQ